MGNVDKFIREELNKNNVVVEINKLQGRIDFLYLCEDIPKEVRDRELENAHRQMSYLISTMIILNTKKGGK